MFSQLLGFDLRQAGERYVSTEWSRERRGRYLLNSSVLWPLSVDKMVWPTIFRYGELEGNNEPNMTVFVETNDFHLDALELWGSPSDMFRAARQSGVTAASDAVPIAVELLLSQPLVKVDYWQAVLDGRYTAAPINKDWKCLGYDVADCYRLSGLTNCSYRDQDRRELNRDWGGDLNEFGLFRNSETALKFTKVTDRRVPEHAPFFAYGLYSTKTLKRD